jgi:hypothetical protein
MPITANKGHSQRVLEYKAGLHGIVCKPFSDGAPDGWWYPDGVRTERESDTPATPYVLMANKDGLPLKVFRPQKIGLNGNGRPAGGEYWVSVGDPRLAVSWDYGGAVFMRGIVVLTGLNKVLAATLCGPWLVVWTATTALKCLVSQINFRGDWSFNAALLEATGATYSDDAFAESPLFGAWGAYISPLGSKVVLLTETKIRTFSVSCTAALLSVNMVEANQNTPPAMTDLARLTVNDDFVWTDGSPSLPAQPDTWLGGQDGAATATYSFEYQYGVSWSGESANPVMLTINRNFAFSFDFHADAYFLQEISGVQLDEGGGTFVKQVDYSETHTTVITGLGAPIEVLNKAMTNSLTRTHTCDALDTFTDPEAGLRANCTISLAIAGTDTTTKRTPTLIAGDGSAAVFTEYTGDESADDIAAEYIDDVPVPNELQGGWSGMRYYPTGPGDFFNYSFGGVADSTYSGTLQKTVVAELDGAEVLRHPRAPTQDIPSTIGYYFYPNRINTRTYGGYSFPDGIVDDGRVSSSENLFDLGFMQVSALSRQGDTKAARAQYGGKTVLQVDRELAGDALPLVFVSDHGDGLDFLDVPAGAEVSGLSVI